jgi:hypothetical protein
VLRTRISASAYMARRVQISSFGIPFEVVFRDRPFRVQYIFSKSRKHCPVVWTTKLGGQNSTSSTDENEIPILTYLDLQNSNPLLVFHFTYFEVPQNGKFTQKP